MTSNQNIVQFIMKSKTLDQESIFWGVGRKSSNRETWLNNEKHLWTKIMKSFNDSSHYWEKIQWSFFFG